eukprot:TRINITY_DN10297_c0_g1_i1.p1 TRINITY_DN10297_c0_g1~~TRINITY_DN10297_c0_g1_i1.p1  ORF type:complete len:632 (+),score=106.71 TRINITY_DN10297_c0_g1_i1:38-1897(+)
MAVDDCESVPVTPFLSPRDCVATGGTGGHVSPTGSALRNVRNSQANQHLRLGERPPASSATRAGGAGPSPQQQQLQPAARRSSLQAGSSPLTRPTGGSASVAAASDSSSAAAPRLRRKPGGVWQQAAANFAKQEPLFITAMRPSRRRTQKKPQQFRAEQNQSPEQPWQHLSRGSEVLTTRRVSQLHTVNAAAAGPTTTPSSSSRHSLSSHQARSPRKQQVVVISLSSTPAAAAASPSTSGVMTPQPAAASFRPVCPAPAVRFTHRSTSAPPAWEVPSSPRAQSVPSSPVKNSRPVNEPVSSGFQTPQLPACLASSPAATFRSVMMTSPVLQRHNSAGGICSAAETGGSFTAAPHHSPQRSVTPRPAMTPRNCLSPRQVPPAALPSTQLPPGALSKVVLPRWPPVSAWTTFWPPPRENGTGHLTPRSLPLVSSESFSNAQSRKPGPLLTPRAQSFHVSPMRSSFVAAAPALGAHSPCGNVSVCGAQQSAAVATPVFHIDLQHRSVQEVAAAAAAAAAEQQQRLAVAGHCSPRRGYGPLGAAAAPAPSVQARPVPAQPQGHMHQLQETEHDDDDDDEEEKRIEEENWSPRRAALARMREDPRLLTFERQVLFGEDFGTVGL